MLKLKLPKFGVRDLFWFIALMAVLCWSVAAQRNAKRHYEERWENRVLEGHAWRQDMERAVEFYKDRVQGADDRRKEYGNLISRQYKRIEELQEELDRPRADNQAEDAASQEDYRAEYLRQWATNQH